MEIGDFIPLILALLILVIPFVWIYLILYTLKWSERKNLFTDSWAVFLAWIFSGLIVWVFCMSPEFGFYKLFHSNFYVSFFTFTLIANIFSVAAVLKSRETKKKLSIVGDEDEKNKRNNSEKIWRASVIISILTLAMVTSLVMFVNDISEKMEKPRPQPNQNSGYAVYE